MELSNYVKKVIEKEKDEVDGPFLTEDDIKELLSEEYEDEACRDGIIGFPTRPLYREIAMQITRWMDTSKCPIEDLPHYDLLDEKEYTEQRVARIAGVGPLLAGVQSLWELWAEDERCFRVRQILKGLDRRGLLDLLGIRKTVGTVEVWPPPRKLIESTFEAKHKPDSPSLLTVGARALAKHCHRDHSASWWGIATGTETKKNEHATEVLKKILNNATWLNIHQLPHDIVILETRQENGYGVRWTSDGLQFRGFLEPQMVDGHEIGWKH